MKRLFFSFSSAVAIVTAWPAVGAPIDFTPSEMRTVEDGMPMQRFAFKDGPAAIFFKPPKGWQVQGGGNEITFTAAPPLAGEIRLGNSTLDPSIRFEAQGLDFYRAAARMLPKQAGQIEVLSEGTNAFPLDDWQSFETFVSYDLLGAKRTRWVLFVTMNPGRQIRLVADGDAAKFEEIHAAARALLGSWFEPPAGWAELANLQAR